MYVIAFETTRMIYGKTRHYAVCARKKPLIEWRDQFKNDLGAWRLHDGSGWADGSPESWRVFDTIVGVDATVII